jgi:hypothetical protein
MGMIFIDIPNDDEFDTALFEMGRNNELYDYFVSKHVHSDDKGFMAIMNDKYQCIFLLSILSPGCSRANTSLGLSGRIQDHSFTKG